MTSETNWTVLLMLRYSPIHSRCSINGIGKEEIGFGVASAVATYVATLQKDIQDVEPLIILNYDMLLTILDFRTILF